jgi:hypothetical protein
MRLNNLKELALVKLNFLNFEWIWIRELKRNVSKTISKQFFY